MCKSSKMDCKDQGEKLTKCKEQLANFEKLVRSYGGNTENTSNMRSSQNNIRLLNVGYDSNSNGKCNCGIGLWSVLEILVTLAQALLWDTLSSPY